MITPFEYIFRTLGDVQIQAFDKLIPTPGWDHRTPIHDRTRTLRIALKQSSGNKATIRPTSTAGHSEVSVDLFKKKYGSYRVAGRINSP